MLEESSPLLLPLLEEASSSESIGDAKLTELALFFLGGVFIAVLGDGSFGEKSARNVPLHP